LAHARNARGALKLCALSPKLAEVLRVTHLDSVFESYESEAEAIGAIYHHRARSTNASFRFGTDILCVHESWDVQAYVRELLELAGYSILTASNLPDALILMRATQPKLVVIGANLRQAGGTPPDATFNRLAQTLPVIELPADFSRWDAGEAGRSLLAEVRAIIVAP
jgi:CheY-like chemotaxis protein